MFTAAYKRYALTAMTALYLFNLVDRGLMILLLQPIKEDLHLTDTQLGFLTGIAFGLFYAVMGVPLARWADCGNRVTIASLSIGLWALVMMACVAITNYLQLALSRVAAAVGEAGCKPPTYSLIGDYFPESAERTRAMAVFIGGNYLSTLVSFIAGGWLNEHYGWRLTFFLMGIPGLILALLFKLTIAEPRVRASSRRLAERPLPPLREVFAVLWRQPSLRHLTFALILLFTMGLGLSPWYAAFMIRSHGMGTAELGVWLGLIFGLSGTAGVLLGGYLASRWFADNERGQMRLSAVAVSWVVPCFVGFLTLPGKELALVSLVPIVLILGIFLGPTLALMQRLVPENMRATTLALVMLLANLIGMGLGPQMVGVLSDGLAPLLEGESLRYAMLAMSFLALWGAWHFWQVGQTVKKDLEGSREREMRYA